MHQLYEQIRNDIMSLTFPPGERFSERVLETRYSGSRTPIRAALARLEVDGLVQRDDRGWAVMPLSFQEIELASEFRGAVEREAVALACKRASPSEIDAIEEMVVSIDIDMSFDEWHRAGRDFHVELARLSGNGFFVRAIEDVMTRLGRARWLEIRTEIGRERTVTEHCRILDLVRRGDVEAAASAVSLHAESAQARHLEALMGVARHNGGLVVVGGGQA
ncbi:GntR family transcriptional regulator [Aurantimonas sp. A2-1-M11]|uniref:GntR family transcriptional regulator n=1 Tax=Aurantimonas sp. A2-1-M11 TaxID=3113712 RepID=UPI002F953ADF